MTLPRLLAFCGAMLWAADARAQEKELYFEGPKEAPIPQFMKAATELAARCEIYDLKGVQGTVAVDLGGRSLVKLSHPQGFPPEKREAIEFLASFPASKIELRGVRKLAKSETEKYPLGGAAPEGASWVLLFNWERLSRPFEIYRKDERTKLYLLRNQPVLDASGKMRVLRHDGKAFHRQKLDSGVYLEFPKDLTKALHATVTKDPDHPDKDLFLMTILVDGVRLDTGGGAMRWFTTARGSKEPDLAVWSIKELSDSKVLPILLEHPLPFALKRPE